MVCPLCRLSYAPSIFRLPNGREFMLAIIALVCFLCAIVLAIILSPRAWPVALIAAGLACWLAETGAGLIP
jgi:hypothetical protein